MSVWERQYRDAVAGITSPGSLDEKILQRARQFKPVNGNRRWVSKTASGCAAIAIAILLVHPAQYLGALTPNLSPSSAPQRGPLANWQHKPVPAQTVDPWFSLRSQVDAGSYIELCSHWRRQQRNAVSEPLPRDLADEARAHCRLLP